MKQRYTILLLLSLFLLLPQLRAEDPADEIIDIVVLNSYHPTFQWTRDIGQAIVDEFGHDSRYRISIEFMDTKRFHLPRHLQANIWYYREKYHSIEVDALLCSDNHAFEFALQHGNDIWGQVPVTFCGVSNIADYDIDSTRYKGVREDLNYRATLELIATLQPELEELIVLSDSTLSGQLFSQLFEETAKTMPIDFTYRIIHATDAEKVGAQLCTLNPENKAIYLLSLYLPRNGATREIIQEAEFLRECLDVPVYGNWDFLFGDFIAGGMVLKGYDQGQAAARLLRARLEAERDTFPFLSSVPEYLITDYKVLQGYNLHNTPLPKGSQQINRPENYWQKNQQEIVVVGLTLGFLMVVIMVLLHLLARHRQMEQALKKSENRLEMALEGARIGLWDVDMKQKTLFINSWVATHLNYDDTEMATFHLKNWERNVHPDDQPQLQEAFDMHKKGITPTLDGEARLRTAEGGYKWFSLHGKLISRGEGEEQRMIGILIDIEIQRQFEEQLRRAKERAEESDRLKSSFLANMSHEIRTPMNAILGFSDILLQERNDPTDSQKFLQLIRSSGESLLALINDIIDISKIESGQFSLNLSLFDLHSLLDKLEHMAHTLMDQKHKNLRFHIHKGSLSTKLMMEGDPFRIEQILTNLISNAIKFTQEGSITLSYQLEDENLLTFSVKDTGKGIAPEHQQLIFERFRQIDPHESSNMGGTGLGLAITKSLVQLMGGDIQVQSQKNQGATFLFRLPCKIYL